MTLHHSNKKPFTYDKDLIPPTRVSDKLVMWITLTAVLWAIGLAFLLGGVL